MAERPADGAPPSLDPPEVAARLRAALGAALVGQEAVVEEVLLCLFAGGHALLEGVPGLGKTLLVRALADALDLAHARVQCTPDLMPADVTGTRLVVEDAHGAKRFELAKGPVFTQLLLADEINRATPKTQSALLEAMAEGTVTLAGERHALPEPFVVIATQNPIEMEGTYPLPEAQLDRFLLKVHVPSPDEDTLVSILERTTGGAVAVVPRVLDAAGVRAVRARVRDVALAPTLARWVARLVRATDPRAPEAAAAARAHLRVGAGVRAAQAVVLAAKAHAALAGRDHVAFADLRRVVRPALRHRVLPSFEAEADGVATDAILDSVLSEVPELPRGAEALG